MSTPNLATKQKTFSQFVLEDKVKNQILATIGDKKKGEQFISSIISVVTANPSLKECEPMSVLNCALLGNTLNLSPSPQLKKYYLVPFEDRKNNRKVATFILGYGGYIELALRTGQYKKINVAALKKGELKKFDPVSEEYEIQLVSDGREKLPTTDYIAFFELNNGFKKALRWSREKMIEHAKTYSPGFKNDLAKGTQYTFWSKQFDEMANKTMIRQLLSKWGLLSIEIQQAIDTDYSVVNNDGSTEHTYENDLSFEQVNSPTAIENQETGEVEIVEYLSDKQIDDLLSISSKKSVNQTIAKKYNNFQNVEATKYDEIAAEIKLMDMDHAS